MYDSLPRSSINLATALNVRRGWGMCPVAQIRTSTIGIVGSTKIFDLVKETVRSRI